MGKTALALSGDCRGLTDKQRRFVAEYTIDYNATRAAKVAGYKNPKAQGAVLLKKTAIARAIGKIQKGNLEEAILSKEEIIAELSTIAMRDPLDMCNEEGIFVIDDMRKIPADIRRAIDGIRVKQRYDDEGNVIGQEFELKLVGKATAFRMLMEHFGMFAPQKHEISVGPIDWENLFDETQQDTDVIDAEINKVRDSNRKKLEHK